MICKECKAEISENICPNCGYKNISKNKRIFKTSVVFIILIFFVILLAMMLAKINENRKIEICISEGKIFSEQMTVSKENMDIIGMFYSSSTKMNYGYSWDEEFFTNYVTSLNSTEISEEKTNKLDITSQYESIKEIECKNDEIENFQKQADNLYSAYEDLYDLLIEQNFTYKNFEIKYTQISDEFTMALELYNSTLEKLCADK